MTLTPLILALPWLGLVLFEAFRTRLPSGLPRADVADVRGAPTADPRARTATPLVSVVVPARNEARSIVACLSSITRSTYPRFEVVVVDDRSEDDTAELARSVPPGNAERVVVVDGEELPTDWLGKPWACHQGAREARGALLLFTDADTVHGPDLLLRAVSGMREERADLLTVVGRQLMESFWERVVQPHVFFLMLLRFPDFERTARNDDWREAIANGQFLLFSRPAYEAVGGHRAVYDEVVEDLALAQVVKRAGLALRIRSAEDDLATRMYRSLGDIVEGWSKNMLMGGLQSVPAWLRPLLPPVAFAGEVALWLVAPAVLALALVAWVDPALPAGRIGPSPSMVVWAAYVYAFSVVLWVRFHRRMGSPTSHAPLYPLAAGVFSFIFLRSWIRGRRVEWKGRSYELRPVSERR